MDLRDLKLTLDGFKSNLVSDEVRLKMTQDKIAKNNKDIKELESDALILEQTAILLQKTAERKRAYVTQKIELIGTSAIQYVYGQDYRLSLELNNTKKNPECEVYVVNTVNGKEHKFKPHTNKGGGVIDIVSLALRFAVLQVFNEPAIDGPVLSDEPGKHVSDEFSPLLSHFMNALSAETNRQQIVITHNDFLAESASTVTRVKKIGDISVAERER